MTLTYKVKQIVCSLKFAMLKAFLETSTIHGLSYLSPASKTSKLWQLFWLCCISISLSVAAALIRANYLNWKNQTPVISQFRRDTIQARIPKKYFSDFFL